MFPLVESDAQIDSVTLLERRMVRIRAFHKELLRILDAEYAAGTANDLNALQKLILRKQNCVNRFEHLFGSMGAQLGMMAGRKRPSTQPRTLVNRVKMVEGLTSEQEAVLLALASDFDQRHLELMKAASRNGLLFKRLLNRMSITSKYVDHRNMEVP